MPLLYHNFILLPLKILSRQYNQVAIRTIITYYNDEHRHFLALLAVTITLLGRL